jgi:hypothetical protein
LVAFSAIADGAIITSATTAIRASLMGMTEKSNSRKAYKTNSTLRAE